MIINHSENFVSPSDPNVHYTKNVESVWRDAKTFGFDLETESIDKL